MLRPALTTERNALLSFLESRAPASIPEATRLKTKKNGCGRHGCKGILVNGVMPEEGTDWPIIKCTQGGWWEAHGDGQAKDIPIALIPCRVAVDGTRRCGFRPSHDGNDEVAYTSRSPRQLDHKGSRSLRVPSSCSRREGHPRVPGGETMENEIREGGCPDCMGALVNGVMPEEGVDWHIITCARCGWWGSRWD